MLKRQKKLLGYQLKREDDVIRTLERQYRYALRAINEKIQMYQADEQTVSRIHHLNYQKRLKQQIEADLDKLHAGEYTTIQQYLDDAYTDGFVGTMYDLAGQGVPVIAPIDRNAAIKAVTTNSKLSTDLYNSLGVDLQTLKKSVRSEITRGIASGMAYSDIARNIANATATPLNRAKTIVRTEGHRIQEESRDDARMAAKARGAEIVKQWEATLDGETRPTHRQLDGQIREVDQPFTADGKEAMYPGDFGDPAEDCNCRCMALTRARKALMNPDELQRMQERAAFFELDKTQDFETFREKYMKAAETLKNQGESGIMKTGGVLDNFSRKVTLTPYTEDLKVVNPNYETGQYKWQNNCQRCVSTYEMRRRGYDVTAKPLPGGLDDDYLAQWFEHAWNNAKREWCLSGSGKKQVEEYMALWGDGARAVVGVGFTPTAGHVFFAERINGKTVFVDPQNASADCSEYFKRALKGRTHVTRVDNLSPSEHIIDCCEDRR